MWDGHLGTVNITTHRIEIEPDSKSSLQRPYRAGPRQRELEKEEVHKMLAAGVIEPSISEWAAPVVFAPKKDGTLRFCIDYRRLNAVTIRDSYPIPRMDECIDSLGDAQVFSTLDCNSGYWQIEVETEDRPKTAFVTHHGVYQYTRMPFGLKNAPATFQRAVDMILASVKWQYAIVYLDDIVIFSRNVEEHLKHIRTVLTLLRAAGMSLKMKKCFFLQRRVEYLGHVVSPGKLAVASKTVDTIQKMKPPRTVTELRSFLGLGNYFRKYVKDYAKITEPLNRKLRKTENPTYEPLSERELEAFGDVKLALTSPPVLALPKLGLPYVLDTDACDVQIGCVLQQEYSDNTIRPIGFFSRTLNKAERNYNTTQRECLAIVWAMLLLRPYLEGVHFTLRTDHDALTWLMGLTIATGKLARWRLPCARARLLRDSPPGGQAYRPRCGLPSSVGRTRYDSSRRRCPRLLHHRYVRPVLRSVGCNGTPLLHSDLVCDRGGCLQGQ